MPTTKRAFGMQTEPGGERVDHVSAELELLQLLSAKEAVGRAASEEEHIALCEDAIRVFLRDHLAPWTTRFTTKLAEVDAGGVYTAAALLLERFVAFEERRLQASRSAGSGSRPRTRNSSRSNRKVPPSK